MSHMTQGHERPATLSDLVAEEIRALMARRRMTGKALAEALGVSPAWVSYRLTGTQPIDLNDLERIAETLEVDPLDLFPPARDVRPAERSTHRPRPTSPRPHPAPKPRPRMQTVA